MVNILLRKKGSIQTEPLYEVYMREMVLKGLWPVSSSDRDKQRAGIRREQSWDCDRDRVVSPGQLFSAGAV